MILFEVDAQGYVKSTPSLIPQGMALSDIVIITESDYELVTLRLIPPSGRYIPDVVCTPVKTQDKSATLWQAILPAEAAAMHGVLTYQIFRRNVQGRVIPTQEGALTVQRGVISDMPENVGHLETYSIESLYTLLSQIHAKDEDHDRGIEKNAADIDEINALLYGYREGEPAEGKAPGAVLASVKAVDQKVETNKTNITANAAAIAANAKNISTNTQNLTALTSKVNDPAHGLSAVEHKIDNFLYGVTDEARDQLSEVLGLIEENGDQIADLIAMGGTIINRVIKTGSGGNVDVEVKNNTIYSISGYNTITILPPEGNYTAHLFVEFPSNADAVGFVLPKDMEVSGNDPSTAAKGERWEVNIDSIGGAIFLRKAVLP